ncbi:hypothetical protein OG468_40515 [Streptomyces zaomyceticus]|uniref:Uncharacterized protein n=1 Tax=Streptomyces zaomyceticus TaxID=68286 RepID=A0ABZ1LSI0_9ACTN
MGKKITATIPLVYSSTSAPLRRARGDKVVGGVFRESRGRRDHAPSLL